MASGYTVDTAASKNSDLETKGKHLGNIAERLDSVDNKLDGLTTKQVQLERVVCGEDGVCEDLEGAKSELGETQADLSTLKDIVSENVHTMKLLTSIIAKQDRKINSMAKD